MTLVPGSSQPLLVPQSQRDQNGFITLGDLFLGYKQFSPH